MCYQVLDRGNGRNQLFHADEDYGAVALRNTAEAMCRPAVKTFHEGDAAKKFWKDFTAGN
ncbi:MAG: hypothetical protein JXB62_18090 [Pirellulales bacterium]|nr:hypothetical protein [Pirellulales bacterium]